MTAFANIVTALLANLSASVAVSPNIHRAVLRPLPDTENTAVVVRWLGALPERFELAGYPIDMTTQIAIECYARSTTTPADLAIDALLEAVYTRLMSDQTLGGTVGDINFTELHCDFSAEAQQFSHVTLTLEVRHRTNGANLS
jgi:hypothetical protein